MMTALCLGLAALILRWVTTERENLRTDGAAPVSAASTEVVEEGDVPFSLTLSASARKVEILDVAGEMLWQKQDENLVRVQGSLARLPETLVLRVSWKDPSAPRFFAKMVIDPPGRDSLTHVFDAPGELDDLWELP